MYEADLVLRHPPLPTQRRFPLFSFIIHKAFTVIYYLFSNSYRYMISDLSKGFQDLKTACYYSSYHLLSSVLLTCSVLIGLSLMLPLSSRT